MQIIDTAAQTIKFIANHPAQAIIGINLVSFFYKAVYQAPAYPIHIHSNMLNLQLFIPINHTTSENTCREISVEMQPSTSLFTPSFCQEWTVVTYTTKEIEEFNVRKTLTEALISSTDTISESILKTETIFGNQRSCNQEAELKEAKKALQKSTGCILVYGQGPLNKALVKASNEHFETIFGLWGLMDFLGVDRLKPYLGIDKLEKWIGVKK